MCGILGIIGEDINTFIQRANRTIAHRGPDDEGIYIDGQCALAHRRLSIQDTSSNGHQPMLSHNERYVITFNGEIYNHWDIRNKLKGKYQFKSTSDTETLLYGYMEYGEKILNMLNGIFAFAIFDSQKKELFLARDHFGVKPLYYYYKNNSFLFSSEVKAFLAFPDLDKSLSGENLMDYLHFLWSPGKGTPFKHIKKLEPGHCMKLNLYEHERFEIKKYYEIPFYGEYVVQSEKKWIDELEEKLFTAVNRQLLSDVPIGFFLSGGLDSSLVAAMAKQANPGQVLKCFTIETSMDRGKEGFIDDLPYAKLAAKHLDAELEIVKANYDIVQDFTKMIWHLDEPQADAAPLNVMNISAMARDQGYVVLLGGTGADDLFSGYRRHLSLYYEQYARIIPNSLKRALAHWAADFRVSTPLLRRIKKFLVHFDAGNEEERMANYYKWLPIEENRNLFSESMRGNLKDYDPRRHLLDSLDNIPKEKNRLNQMLYWELKYFLPDHNLNYTDKMSMAHGVEVRVPYLDKDLVEFSTTIPPELKMKGKTTKYLLRKVAERYLPNEIVYRPKTGFGAPIRDWVCGPLDDKIRSSFTPEMCKRHNIFDSQKVLSLVERNKKDILDASYPIWGLLAIVNWWEQFVQ